MKKYTLAKIDFWFWAILGGVAFVTSIITAISITSRIWQIEERLDAVERSLQKPTTINITDQRPPIYITITNYIHTETPQPPVFTPTPMTQYATNIWNGQTNYFYRANIVTNTLPEVLEEKLRQRMREWIRTNSTQNAVNLKAEEQ